MQPPGWWCRDHVLYFDVFCTAKHHGCIQSCAILALTLGVSGTVVDLLSFQQIYLAIWQLSAGGWITVLIFHQTHLDSGVSPCTDSFFVLTDVHCWRGWVWQWLQSCWISGSNLQLSVELRNWQFYNSIKSNLCESCSVFNRPYFRQMCNLCSEAALEVGHSALHQEHLQPLPSRRFHPALSLTASAARSVASSLPAAPCCLSTRAHFTW